MTGAPRGIAVWSRSSGSANQSADFDGDGQVGFSDFLVFASSFGTSFGALDHDDRTDLDGNGVVDFSDFILFAEAFGR